MIRTIIEIDRDKCDGCGQCITGCHEGALQLIDGKATLMSETYCDGLGACIGDCPVGAIRLVEREAPEFNEAAVAKHLAASKKPAVHQCPGAASALRQWPVQLPLINPMVPWLADADLLLAADCAAFASGSFHRDLLKGKVLAIACPKLDGRREEYIAKLTEMIDFGGIRSLTVLTMTVPCCNGLYQIASTALQNASRKIPFARMVMALDGSVMS